MSVAIAHGYLPRVRYIYNHDIMNCTAEGVVGNHLYSGRALGLTEPWDLIQLHPDLEPLWPAINAHYKRVGLSHTEDVIWHVVRDSLGEHIGYHPSVFFFGPHEFCFWGDDQWLETVEFINSKNNFMALAENLGVEVPETRCYDHVGEVPVDHLLSSIYPCYLKAAVSVSGVGIYRCESREELAEAVTRFESCTPVQIQEEVLTDRFLNLQYQVIGDELIRLEASEQILEGCAHQGNKVPTDHQPWDVVEPMAIWLKERGIRGVFAFDVAVVETPQGYRYPAIECNPRFNGASYPTMIAHKLGIREWTATTFHTRYRDLEDIDLTGLEYDTRTGEGAVIVNWGTVLEGKLVILMAGTPAYREALALELKAVL